MDEQVKQEMKAELEKAKEELEGKNLEELNDMMKQADEEIYEKAHNDASEYVFNIMELGPTFSKEAYAEFQKKLDEQNDTEEGVKEFVERFTKFDTPDIRLNIEVLNQGYRQFGRDFICAMVDKDPESAKILFELVSQMYLTLSDDINETAQNVQAMMKEKEKVEKLTEEIKESNN